MSEYSIWSHKGVIKGESQRNFETIEDIILYLLQKPAKKETKEYIQTAYQKIKSGCLLYALSASHQYVNLSDQSLSEETPFQIIINEAMYCPKKYKEVDLPFCI